MQHQRFWTDIPYRGLHATAATRWQLCDAPLHLWQWLKLLRQVADTLRDPASSSTSLPTPCSGNGLVPNQEAVPSARKDNQLLRQSVPIKSTSPASSKGKVQARRMSPVAQSGLWAPVWIMLAALTHAGLNSGIGAEDTQPLLPQQATQKGNIFNIFYCLNICFKATIMKKDYT